MTRHQQEAQAMTLRLQEAEAMIQALQELIYRVHLVHPNPFQRAVHQL